MENNQDEGFDLDKTAANVSGMTTSAVLGLFDGKINTKQKISSRLRRKPETVKYHLSKLKDLELIEEVGEHSKGESKKYKLTLKGEKVLERVHVPETEEVRKQYYGGNSNQK